MPSYETKSTSLEEKNKCVENWLKSITTESQISDKAANKECSSKVTPYDATAKQVECTPKNTPCQATAVPIKHFEKDITLKRGRKCNYRDDVSSDSSPLFKQSESEYEPSSIIPDTFNSDENSDELFNLVVDKKNDDNLSRKGVKNYDNDENASDKIKKIEVIKNSDKLNNIVVGVRYNDHLDENMDENCDDDILISDEFEKVTVVAAKKNKISGKRIRDRGHSCYFCQKIIINMARHLEVMYANEIEVAKVLAFAKGSKRRKD